MNNATKVDDGGFVYHYKTKELVGYDPAISEIQSARYVDVEYPGITRRDWLAGLAMQGMLGNPKAIQESLDDAKENNCNPTESLSFIAYQYADAIIAEGRK